MDTTFEMGIIVNGTSVLDQSSEVNTTLVEGDCLIFIIPSLGKLGLFSVPAPSQHPRGVRRGFLFVISIVVPLHLPSANQFCNI